MTAELEAAANGEIDILGRNEVGADIIAEIDEWLWLGFRLMSCGCVANKYGEAAHGPEEEHEVGASHEEIQVAPEHAERRAVGDEHHASHSLDKATSLAMVDAFGSLARPQA